ncbi:hypothetical protein E2C01_078135 [Portunus trituberculatus]|uniref:Uncharacterized protein n=1 Tax=Portunus trituberculatus TaxID=210409 RepID=A0A5B7IP50_PORTR|nr:hypothetical protein [Portunus trituberculatus]
MVELQRMRVTEEDEKNTNEHKRTGDPYRTLHSANLNLTPEKCRGTVEPYVLWVLRGSQDNRFESWSRSECRKGFYSG